MLADHLSARLSFTRLFDSYDYFASGMALIVDAEGLGGLTESVGPLDDRPDLSRLEELAQQGDIFFVQLGRIPDELLIAGG